MLDTATHSTTSKIHHRAWRRSSPLGTDHLKSTRAASVHVVEGGSCMGASERAEPTSGSEAIERTCSDCGEVSSIGHACVDQQRARLRPRGYSRTKLFLLFSFPVSINALHPFRAPMYACSSRIHLQVLKTLKMKLFRSHAG